jgi:molybdate transport system substrate-binding protein
VKVPPQAGGHPFPSRLSSNPAANVFFKRTVLLVCLLFLAAPFSYGQEVFVAAASSLNFAIREIIEEFESRTPHRVRLSLASSGTLFNQIQNGAPFDVYLSADRAYPEQLELRGLVDPCSGFLYALGRIVVWVRNGSPVDVQALGVRSLVEATGKIAIANPRHAPYGRAAVAVMEHFGIWNSVSDRIVLGENVSQAAQFVQSGAAGIGIIPLSLALSGPMNDTGRYWELPSDAHPALEQEGVILASARSVGRLEAARAFTDWLRGARGRAVLREYGFDLGPAPGGPR